VKRIIGLLMIMILIFSGCSADSEQMERALALRGKVQQSDVSFDAKVTADYGDKVYTFSMHCQGDKIGNLKFSVTDPQTIAGISGTVSKESGKLTFDDQVLSFGVLADGLISPVCGPWVLLETLRSGYLTSCTAEGELLRLAIDDSYERNALHLDVWIDQGDLPQSCDIYWQGRRLLSITVKNFTFL